MHFYCGGDGGARVIDVLHDQYISFFGGGGGGKERCFPSGMASFFRGGG